MGIQVTSLDQLATVDVEQLFEELSTFMQERYPAVELTRGPFHDLVLYFSAVFSALNQENITRVTNSQSLLKITEDPTLADDDIVNAVLSNFSITRRPGAKATGTVTVVTDSNLSVIVPSGLIFSANGVEFVVDTAFTAKPTTATASTDTDRVLQALNDTQYAFTIPVTARETGAAGNLTWGTKMVPNRVLDHYVTAYAAADFTGGSDTETNAELLARMRLGLAAKSVGGRTSLEALIRNQPAFAETLAYSAMGLGDAEMLRDQHTIFPGSFGGRVDLYARTRRLPITTEHNLEALLVDITGDGSVWQVTLPAGLAPGFYEVTRAALLDAGADDTGYEITMDLRGLDTSVTDTVPDMLGGQEAAFSRYQTSVIRFLDTDTITTGLTVNESRKTYKFSIAAMPLLAEIQDFILDPAVGYPAADILVKAPVPCFLTVGFQIQKAAGESDPDTGAIANAVAEVVNTMGFPGKLHASVLLGRVQDFLSGRQAVGQVNMRGRILPPAGTPVYIHSTSVLAIPDLPTEMVTGRTTCFLLDPANVEIGITTVAFAS